MSRYHFSSAYVGKVHEATLGSDRDAYKVEGISAARFLNSWQPAYDYVSLKY